MAQPVAHSYGKAAVSAHRIAGENLFSCEVLLAVRGEAFTTSYTEGDNSMVVATDSMKNFIHRTALDFEGEMLEDLLVEIGARFLDRYEHVTEVELRGSETTFAHRAGVVFQRLYDDRAVAEVTLDRDGAHHERSGREGLHLIKLSGSSFADFVRDEYTTLPESRDRPLFVHLDASWHNADYGRRVDGLALRDELVATFADFSSESIQHLVHQMGVRVLARFPEVDNVGFRAENRLWDTAQQGGGASVYTDARPPFGLITLSLDR
jgi:urate oxidase / 2-oxo-4-hydroxy-4-carboxy-5-ureidoimidazoline decarboxylase